MRRPTLLLLITFLVVASPSAPVKTPAAVTENILFTSLDITTKLYSTGSTLVLIDAETFNHGNDSLSEVSIRMDSLDISLVSASVNGEISSALLTTMERHTMVTVELPAPLNSNRSMSIHLELMAHDLQSNPEIYEDGSLLTRSLIYYVRPHNIIYNLTFTAVLPRHAALPSGLVVSVFPQTNQNMTDGASMIFIWQCPLLQIGQEKVFIVNYEVSYPPRIIEPTNSFLFGFIFILGIFSGVGISKFGPNLLQFIKRSRKVKYVGATEEEQAILDILIANGGLSLQKDLHRKLNLSESKVSILLSSMERRGLIRRFRDGRKNIVHIVEESFE